MSRDGTRRDLPAGWEWKTMGEIATVVGGSTPKSKEPAYWGGDIPWLSVSDLTGYSDMYISRGARSITQAGFDSCAVRMLPAGSVVFSSRAPIGYAAIAANPLCTSQGFKSFVLEDDVDPEYVYWYLKSAKSTAESLASGTTFKELSAKRAARIPIPLPPIEEQRLIGQQLASRVHSLKVGGQKLRQAEQLGSVLSERVRDLAVERRAVKRPFGECLSEPFMNGRSVPTAQDGFPVLRLTAVRRGSIDLSEAKIGAWTSEEAHSYVVQRGDFLIVRGNGSLDLVGRGGLVLDETSHVAFPDTLIRARVDQNVLRHQFLQVVWESRLVRRQIERRARTTAGIYKINQGDLAAIQIPVPSLEEQDALVTDLRPQLDGLRELQTSLQATRVKGESLWRATLRQAFAGSPSQEAGLSYEPI